MNADNFTRYLQAKNYSIHTCKAYGKDVEQFMESIKKQNISISDVGHSAIIQFLESLVEKETTPSTRNRKVEAIKTFFRYLKEQGEISINPLADFKAPRIKNKGEVRYLSEEEYRRLRDLIRNRSTRDYAIVEIALQTGIRISELCSLKTDDLVPAGKNTLGYFIVKSGKGNKDRRVALNSVAQKAIDSYLKIRTDDSPCENLFLSNRKTPMSPRNLNAILKRYFEKSKIKNASFHTLRHTFATHSLSRGSNIIVIKEVLGHESLVTTQRYTHFIRERMEQELERNAL